MLINSNYLLQIRPNNNILDLFLPKKPQKKLNPVEVVQQENKDKRLTAGQSKRILEELYKVIDSSDVLVCIARDPMGTRSYHLENHIKLTSRWVQCLSKEYLSCECLVGYLNVRKSSLINSLKKRKVFKAAPPVPGETRVWQYVELTKRIYSIDFPGVVYQHEEKDYVEVVLKGCVRAEKLEDPEYYIPALLQKANTSDLKRIYDIYDWIDEHDFEDSNQKEGKIGKR